MAARAMMSKAQKIMELYAAAGFETRLVGGCVRNRLWGLPVNDYDLATDASPEQSKAVLQANKIRFHTAGELHGTISALMGGAVYEITTLRVDLHTDGRWAKVSFTDNWAEDARRRDFTINGLFADRHGQIIDLVDGLKDIQSKTLRFIGDPVARIREDYLRILRFFRFWATYQLNITADTLLAISQERAGLAQISRERIRDEVRKMLLAPKVSLVLGGMQDSGVFADLWGSPCPSPTAELLDTPVPKDILDRLVPQGMFYLRFFLLQCLENGHFNLEISPEAFQARFPAWRLSAEEVSIFEELRQCVQLWLTSSHKREELLYKEWKARRRFADFAFFPQLLHPVLWTLLNCPGLIESALALQWTEHFSYFAAAESRFQQNLPLDGNDLMAGLGIPPGPHVGQIIEHLLRAYLLGSWQTKSEGLEAARGLMKV